jgi:hypothetical protein
VLAHERRGGPHRDEWRAAGGGRRVFDRVVVGGGGGGGGGGSDVPRAIPTVATPFARWRTPSLEDFPRSIDSGGDRRSVVRRRRRRGRLRG